MRRGWIALVLLVVAGCASAPPGEPASGFINRDVGNAYIPLEASSWIIFQGDAAAMAMGDGVAVTNAHTENLLDEKTVIGKSADYDLLFFHTDKTAGLPPTAVPQEGERVIAYGQDSDGKLRRANGVITALEAPVKPLCGTCAVQSAFTFKGNAGPGFSGGPVLDADSGKLLGIVFGYVDEADRSRTIYAYPMGRVTAELEKIERKLPTDTD